MREIKNENYNCLHFLEARGSHCEGLYAIIQNNNNVKILFRFDWYIYNAWIVIKGCETEEEIYLSIPEIPLIGGCWSNAVAARMAVGQNYLRFLLDSVYRHVVYEAEDEAIRSCFKHVCKVEKVDRCFYGPYLHLYDESFLVNGDKPVENNPIRNDIEYMDILTEEYPMAYAAVLKSRQDKNFSFWDDYHDVDDVVPSRNYNYYSHVLCNTKNDNDILALNYSIFHEEELKDLHSIGESRGDAERYLIQALLLYVHKKEILKNKNMRRVLELLTKVNGKDASYLDVLANLDDIFNKDKYEGYDRNIADTYDCFRRFSRKNVEDVIKSCVNRINIIVSRDIKETLTDNYINGLKEHLGEQYDVMLLKAKEINDKMKECLNRTELKWDENDEYYQDTRHVEVHNDYTSYYSILWPFYNEDAFRINYHSHSKKEQCVEVGYPNHVSILYTFRELGIEDCIADYYKTNSKSLDGPASKVSFNMTYCASDCWTSKYDKENHK